MSKEQKEITVARFYTEENTPHVWKSSLRLFNLDNLSPGFIEVTQLRISEYPPSYPDEGELKGIAVYAKHPDETTERILFLRVNKLQEAGKKGLLIEKWKVEGGTIFAFSVIRSDKFLKSLGYLSWEESESQSWDGTGSLGDTLTATNFRSFVVRMVTPEEAKELLEEWSLLENVFSSW